MARRRKSAEPERRREFGWIGQIKVRGKTAPGWYMRYTDLDGKVVQRKAGTT
ncbi:MAG: hypothetical protein GY711_04800, partial [bacterium]|nr:hypothetical protein [bacterium]